MQAHLSKQLAVRGLHSIGSHTCYQLYLCQVWLWNTLHTAHTRSVLSAKLKQHAVRGLHFVGSHGCYHLFS